MATSLSLLVGLSLELKEGGRKKKKKKTSKLTSILGDTETVATTRDGLVRSLVDQSAAEDVQVRLGRHFDVNRDGTLLHGVETVELLSPSVLKEKKKKKKTMSNMTSQCQQSSNGGNVNQ